MPHPPKPTTRLAGSQSLCFLEKIPKQDFSLYGPIPSISVFTEEGSPAEGWVLAHVKIRIRRIANMRNLYEVIDSRIYYYGD